MKGNLPMFNILPPSKFLKTHIMDFTMIMWVYGKCLHTLSDLYGYTESHIFVFKGLEHGKVLRIDQM